MCLVAAKLGACKSTLPPAGMQAKANLTVELFLRKLELELPHIGNPHISWQCLLTDNLVLNLSPHRKSAGSLSCSSAVLSA